MFYSYILAISVLKINTIGSAVFFVIDRQTQVQTQILFIYWYDRKITTEVTGNFWSHLLTSNLNTVIIRHTYGPLCLTHGLCTQLLQLNHNIQLCSVCTQGKSCIDFKGFTTDRYRLNARNATSESEGSRPFKSIYRVSYNYPHPHLNF